MHRRHSAFKQRVVDLGIRIVRSASAPIASKLLGRASVGLFASREYVERRLPSGRISRDVAGTHDWVGLDASLERFERLIIGHGDIIEEGCQDHLAHAWKLEGVEV